jgi:hypothetical protein
MIHFLRKKEIKFVFTHGKRNIASIDCYNFITNEFRQDPGGQWFDRKGNSSGLVRLLLLGLMFFLSFPFIMFLTNNSSLSKINMKPALISGRERLYPLENPLEHQHTTYQFFVE